MSTPTAPLFPFLIRSPRVAAFTRRAKPQMPIRRFRESWVFPRSPPQSSAKKFTTRLRNGSPTSPGNIVLARRRPTTTRTCSTTNTRSDDDETGSTSVYQDDRRFRRDCRGRPRLSRLAGEVGQPGKSRLLVQLDQELPIRWRICRRLQEILCRPGSGGGSSRRWTHAKRRARRFIRQGADWLDQFQRGGQRKRQGR